MFIEPSAITKYHAQHAYSTVGVSTVWLALAAVVVACSSRMAADVCMVVGGVVYAASNSPGWTSTMCGGLLLTQGVGGVTTHPSHHSSQSPSIPVTTQPSHHPSQSPLIQVTTHPSHHSSQSPLKPVTIHPSQDSSQQSPVLLCGALEGS